MNRKSVMFLAATLCLTLALFVTATDCLAQSDGANSASEPQKLDSVNAAVVAARAATKEKRYADAEALMLKVTSSRPELVVPRIELALANWDLRSTQRPKATSK
jgi:hypothetical protein